MLLVAAQHRAPVDRGLALLAAFMIDSSSPPAGSAVHTDQSPSGAILADHFWLENGPQRLIGRRQIWLRYANGRGQPRLLFEHERIAEVLFSPDERWIAINDAPLSDLADVRLFRRVGDLKYQEIEKSQPGGKCWALLDRASRPAISGKLDHRYVNAIRWSPDSRALLLKVQGHGSGDISVRDWLCVFDVDREQASTELRLMNRGAVYDPRSP